MSENERHRAEQESVAEGVAEAALTQHRAAPRILDEERGYRPACCGHQRLAARRRTHGDLGEQPPGGKPHTDRVTGLDRRADEPLATLERGARYIRGELVEERGIVEAV